LFKNGQSRVELLVSEHKCSRQVRSRGRASLFLVSKQNSNPSYCISYTKNRKKWIRIEKLMTPQNRGVKNSKTNKQLNATKPILEHPKNSLYVALLPLEF
jgi:hypothetical protein